MRCNAWKRPFRLTVKILLSAVQQELSADTETNSTGNFMSDFSFEPFENIVWAMAKTADNSIPDVQTWLDSFTDFSVIDVFTQLQDIIINSLKSKN